jgi:hypothetical protein
MTTQSLSGRPAIAPPGLELIFHIDARLGPLEDHGITRAGHRRVVPITGGSCTGSISAVIAAGGGDWQLVRPDGTVEVDTRYTLRTADGELLHLRTRGIRSGDPHLLESILAGADVPPSDYYFRLSVEVETSVPKFAWLERSVIVASAARDADGVHYDAYRVT